ncbi:hypothetical protein LBMAG52_14650 [Planctomycetia bacterium]|nr:hypothetical protein LBMAG52_14650 [Planctomycetia bacterium]
MTFRVAAIAILPVGWPFDGLSRPTGSGEDRNAKWQMGLVHPRRISNGMLRLRLANSDGRVDPFDREKSAPPESPADVS